MINIQNLIKVTWLAVMAGYIGWVPPASAQLTIQIVNDSGLSDNDVYIMVPGATGATLNPQGLFVDKNLGTNTSVALSTLATDGLGTSPVVSSISGNTNTMYSFQANYITSGGIYFIYDNPFTFSGGTTPSPAPGGGNGGSGFRYDYAELSFLGGDVNNDVDLTYVDKFGIPLQLEWFHGTNTAATNLIAGSYVYASTKTLANLFAGNGFADAVFSLTNAGAANGDITPGWQYAGGTNPYASFARIVSPEKANKTGASVAPYPDVANYLNSLVASSFTLNGYSVQGGSVSGPVFQTNYLYYYLGYQTSVTTNAGGGWTFTLSYHPDLLPAYYNLTNIGAVASSIGTNVDIPLQYTNTIVFTVPDTNTTICASAFIYGAPVGTNYTVNGTPVSDVTHVSYNVEAWMIGDVLSSINFGFAGGIYGDNSDQWFSPSVAWPNPYGWAQPVPYNNPTNGFFNPYAALMYYNADAYTFAFSERITPDVGMSVQNGDVVRITILPDDRLDSPVVSVPTNTITETSLTLNWSPVSGATGYQINMLRPTGPLGSAPVTVSAATTSHTFSDLSNGAPYVMSVQAIGVNANNGNPVITPARPVHATTYGTYNPVGGGTIPVLLALNASDPFGQLESVSFNGTNVAGWKTNNSQTVAYQAAVGTNQVLVTVRDNNTNIVFNDWLQFVAATPFPITNIGTNLPNGTTNSRPTDAVTFPSLNSAISGIALGGQLLSALPPVISGGWPAGSVGPVLAPDNTYAIWVTNYTGSPTNFIVSINGDSVAGNTGPVINLSYSPAEIRQFAPGNTANPPPVNPVVITDVTTLPGGGIQFNFNVPEGTNYVVETSGNLINWQTNSTGIGLPGGESFTNAASASAVEFYRIKL